MIYFAKNSGQKPGTASLEYPLFHGSLPPYGYQAVTNVDFAGLNDYFYSPTGWETFSTSNWKIRFYIPPTRLPKDILAQMNTRTS